MIEYSAQYFRRTQMSRYLLQSSHYKTEKNCFARLPTMKTRKILS